jgi:phage tail tape-measure protein
MVLRCFKRRRLRSAEESASNGAAAKLGGVAGLGEGASASAGRNKESAGRMSSSSIKTRASPSLAVCESSDSSQIPFFLMQQSSCDF